MTHRHDGETPSDFLARMLDAHGLSAGAAAAATGGVVSGTTVRAYRQGGEVTPARLLALARVFPMTVGVEVLRAYGLEEMAEAVEAGESLPALQPPPAQERALTYSGPRPLTDLEASAVRAVIAAIVEHP